ncbi:MAG: hypothetical protein ABI361_07665 [Nitrososphaera sp.]
MALPQPDLLTMSAAALLIATFAVIVRRGFLDWLSGYRYQSLVLAAVTAVIGYMTGVWEIYIAAVLTLVIKAIVIPKVLLRVTQKIKGNLGEFNPYISLRASVIISAFLVVFAYALVGETFATSKLDSVAKNYLPVALALFFIGLFAMVSRRVVLSQVVGLLIIENGLFLFTASLTHGFSLLIEVGIFADILISVLISAILLSRISQTFDSLDMGKIEQLRDD